MWTWRHLSTSQRPIKASLHRCVTGPATFDHQVFWSSCRFLFQYHQDLVLSVMYVDCLEKNPFGQLGMAAVLGCCPCFLFLDMMPLQEGAAWQLIQALILHHTAKHPHKKADNGCHLDRACDAHASAIVICWTFASAGVSVLHGH